MNDSKVVIGDGDGKELKKQTKEGNKEGKQTGTDKKKHPEIQQNKALKHYQSLKGCLKFNQILNGMFLEYEKQLYKT